MVSRGIDLQAVRIGNSDGTALLDGVSHVVAPGELVWLRGRSGGAVPVFGTSWASAADSTPTRARPVITRATGATAANWRTLRL